MDKYDGTPDPALIRATLRCLAGLINEAIDDYDWSSLRYYRDRYVEEADNLKKLEKLCADIIEKVNPPCTCGAQHTGGKHSDWCDVP